MMPDKIRKVVLVGPRAAGKTTVGRALADRLGWGFRDTDDLLAAAVGQPAEDYLQNAGEAAFRTIEEQVVGAALLSTDPEVLALGGGAVLSAPVRKALQEKHQEPHQEPHLLVVFLHAPVPVLVERQAAMPRTPLTGQPLPAEVKALLAARWPHYVSVSDLQLDTASANVDACLWSIMDKMGPTS
ncbi:MAG: shikimate kinase [Planctomycetota bacterium]